MTYRIERQKEPISPYTRWLGIFFLSLIVGALHIGVVGSMLRLIAAIPVIIWLLNRRNVRFSSPIVCFFLFVVWISVSFTWSIHQPHSLLRIVAQCSFLLLLLSAASYRFTAHEIEFLKKCLVWGSRITAVAVLISSDYIVGRIYINGVVREDPNYLCAYYSFAIVAAMMSLVSGGVKWWVRLFSVFETIVYTYIILGSGSRGGLFAVVSAIAVVILFSRPQADKTAHMVRRVGLVLILFVAAYVAATLIEKDILLRFTLSEIEESGGTGRYEIWDNALDTFGQSDILRQLCGYGTGTARDLTYLFPFARHSVFHNLFFENLLEVGVIGFLLYCFHIFSFFGAALKCRDLFCIAVLICMIVLSLSTSIYTFKPYWNTMLIILCCMNKEPDPEFEPEFEPGEGERICEYAGRDAHE